MNNSWPKECESGLIQTKNAMGVMTTELSPVALKFIDEALLRSSLIIQFETDKAEHCYHRVKCTLH